MIEDGFKTLNVSLKKNLYLNCNDITEYLFLQPEAIAVIALAVSKLVNSARVSVIDSDMIYAAVGFHLSKKNSRRWNSTLYELTSERQLKLIQLFSSNLTL